MSVNSWNCAAACWRVIARNSNERTIPILFRWRISCGSRPEFAELKAASPPPKLSACTTFSNEPAPFERLLRTARRLVQPGEERAFVILYQHPFAAVHDLMPLTAQSLRQLLYAAGIFRVNFAPRFQRAPVWRHA